MPRTNYIDIMEKNHMEIPWHDYTNADSNALIANADLIGSKVKIKTVERQLCIFNCFLFLAYWATAHHEIARRAMNGSAAYVSSTTNTFTFSSILFAISLKCFASSAICVMVLPTSAADAEVL